MADNQWTNEEFNVETGDTGDFVFRPAFDTINTNEDREIEDRRMCRSVLDRPSERRIKEKKRVFYSALKTGDGETYIDGSSTEKESIMQSSASHCKDLNKYVRDSSLKRIRIK